MTLHNTTNQHQTAAQMMQSIPTLSPRTTPMNKALTSITQYNCNGVSYYLNLSLSLSTSLCLYLYTAMCCQQQLHLDRLRRETDWLDWRSCDCTSRYLMLVCIPSAVLLLCVPGDLDLLFHLALHPITP